MKKVILCVSVFAITLTSCSSDSDSSSNPVNPEPTGILVKSVTYTSITDDYTENVVYTYNGNKLVKGVYDDGSEERYTYSGNLITKIEFIVDGNVDSSELFSYDSTGRLIGYTYQEGDFTDQENFVYNTDGTVTSTFGTRTLYFENDELTKITDGTRTYLYTYDSKNSPFRNVTGYDKIAYVVSGDHEFIGRNQNITSIYESFEGINYMTNTMTYNSNNYPVSVTSAAIFESEPNTATIQYTYY